MVRQQMLDSDKPSFFFDVFLIDHLFLLLRIVRSLRAFCLGDSAFVNPPIGKALSANAGKQIVVTFGV